MGRWRFAACPTPDLLGSPVSDFPSPRLSVLPCKMGLVAELAVLGMPRDLVKSHARHLARGSAQT